MTRLTTHTDVLLRTFCDRPWLENSASLTNLARTLLAYDGVRRGAQSHLPSLVASATIVSCEQFIPDA